MQNKYCRFSYQLQSELCFQAVTCEHHPLSVEHMEHPSDCLSALLQLCLYMLVEGFGFHHHHHHCCVLDRKLSFISQMLSRAELAASMTMSFVTLVAKWQHHLAFPASVCFISTVHVLSVYCILYFNVFPLGLGCCSTTRAKEGSKVF